MAVDGLAKLQSRFRALPKKMRDAVRQAMEVNAAEMVGVMRRIAPKDSGELAASIGWTWGDPPMGSVALGRVDGPSDFAITIYAGNESTIVTNSRGMRFQNAILQEFGRKSSRDSAKPYFFPTVRSLRSRAVGRISRAARRAALEEFGG